MNGHPYCPHLEGETCHCDVELERRGRLPSGARREDREKGNARKREARRQRRAGGVTFHRLTGRQRAIIAELAANADPDPPTMRLPSVAGHIRQVWAPNVQPGRWQQLLRWLHATFTADLPDGGAT